MPHKRNPIGSVLAVACARQAQAQAGVLLGSMVQEHERALGAWHAEWPALIGVLSYAGGAADAARRAVTGLDVHQDRMRANLEASGLGSEVGSAEAHVDRVLAAYREVA
jgi:3-carboxy-cis,cis-muconate cycloisomerase